MMNEFNPDGKDIRFIDSHYRDLFRIPDGGTIQVHYSDDSVVIKPCKFIDEYHTQIGNNVFHICQFAELLERNGSYCQAEPEIMGDEAAWQVGRDQYLAIQTCEDGYDYTLFDKEFHEIDRIFMDEYYEHLRADNIEAFSKERNDEYVGRAEEYKAAKSALLEGLGLEHLFDHSHELTPKEKEIWMLFDRVDVAELLARDAFAKGAYMLGAEDREIMLK